MTKTNTEDFRSNLKEWMESARNEPIKITRKTGESFVLLSSDEFEKLQLELAHLRGLAQGLSDSVRGKTQTMSTESIKSVLNKAKQKLNKKAV